MAEQPDAGGAESASPAGERRLLLVAAPDDPHFERLLNFLKESRAFDFTGYKRPSLIRRIRHRMREVSVTSVDDYIDLLQLHPDEYTSLFNTILINVTGFFRDPEAWEYLRDDILPALLADHDQSPVRVWSAGCAAGQEAYTIAMLLHELMGEEFRDRVKIYATDLDEDALEYARQAVYTEKELRSLPETYRERYFEQVGARWQLSADLRRSVIFGRNDLTQDAPISRSDLLLCRTTLMYLNAETQSRVVPGSASRCAPRACSSSARPRCCSTTPRRSSRSTSSGGSSPRRSRRRATRRSPPRGGSTGATACRPTTVGCGTS